MSMKIRMYKDGDKVYLEYLSKKYEGKEDECSTPEFLKNYEMIKIEASELPEHDYIEQLYLDNENKLHVDSEWNVKLMPEFLVKEKHQARLNNKLDAELEKGNPDAVKVIKLQREKEKMKEWTKKQVYTQALANLDEDGHTKQKVRDKIAEVLNAD